jgi:hypothetical protein
MNRVFLAPIDHLKVFDNRTMATYQGEEKKSKVAQQIA